MYILYLDMFLGSTQGLYNNYNKVFGSTMQFEIGLREVGKIKARKKQSTQESIKKCKHETSWKT